MGICQKTKPCNLSVKAEAREQADFSRDLLISYAGLIPRRLRRKIEE
jgi:hypothetical protein